ncbi:MAG: hypothetical protein E6J29_08280, partial [Chloroflexi bacterium]
RVGKKPLYYHPLGSGGVVFASELKALRLHPAVGTELSPRALGQYLSLNYNLGTDCLLAGVSKLPAGHSLVVDADGIRKPVSYWDLAAAFRAKRDWRSEQDAADELAALIDDAVRLRLISAVPLGAFLSSGIDSGAIVASMCRLRPPEENLTFSIDFEEAGFSEKEGARATARQLGVRHHDRTVDVARRRRAFRGHLDHPDLSPGEVRTRAGDGLPLGGRWRRDLRRLRDLLRGPDPARHQLAAGAADPHRRTRRRRRLAREPRQGQLRLQAASLPGRPLGGPAARALQLARDLQPRREEEPAARRLAARGQRHLR